MIDAGQGVVGLLPEATDIAKACGDRPLVLGKIESVDRGLDGTIGRGLFAGNEPEVGPVDARAHPGQSSACLGDPRGQLLGVGDAL